MPYKLKCSLDGTCDNGFIADLDDRAVQQARVRGNGGDDLVIGRPGIKSQLLELFLFYTQQPERRDTELGEQALDLSFVERFAEIIYPVEINAVFTKQRRQIAAGRSGRFLVNDYLHTTDILPSKARVSRLARKRVPGSLVSAGRGNGSGIGKAGREILYEHGTCL